MLQRADDARRNIPGLEDRFRARWDQALVGWAIGWIRPLGTQVPYRVRWGEIDRIWRQPQQPKEECYEPTDEPIAPCHESA